MKISALTFLLLVACISMMQAESELPHIETLSSRETGARDWRGKTLAEVIPASTIRHIVLFGGRVLYSNDDRALFAYLFGSKQTIRDSGLDARERITAEFMVSTADGQCSWWQIASHDELGNLPSAVLIRGVGHSVRIEIKDFPPPSQ